MKASGSNNYGAPCSFWQYKIYIDIRGGSLDRGIKGQWMLQFVCYVCYKSAGLTGIGFSYAGFGYADG